MQIDFKLEYQNSNIYEIHNHFKKAQAHYYLCINYTILLSVSLYDTYTNTYTEHIDLYIMVDSTKYMFQLCT